MPSAFDVVGVCTCDRVLEILRVVNGLMHVIES
jgi:hypothetical protein